MPPFLKRQVLSASVVVAVALCAAGGTAAAASDPVTLVALVIDTSGSLKTAELENARVLARGLLDRLPPGSQLAVFTFDDQVRLLLPRTLDREALARALRGAHRGGKFTLLNDALYDAVRYLNQQPADRKAIVLFTDGRDENSALRLDDTLKAAQQSSIPVFAVGTGQVEERLLRRVAKLTGGDYFATRAATGPVLAARVIALPIASRPLPAAAPPQTPAPSPPAPQSTPPPAPADSRIPAWALVGGSLVLLGVAAWFVLRARRREASPTCSECGRNLPGPLSPCPSCQPTPASNESATGTELSETVVARMDLTEEYLEKTVTLREEPVLTITAGPGTGMVVSLNRASATSIGRAKANDIVLEDVSVSGQHCRIRPEDGKHVLHDLKSTNGSFVNERRVIRHVLAEGDVIKIGETYLQFRTRQVKP